MTQSILDEHYFDEVFGIPHALEQEDVIDQEVGIFEKLCKNKLEELDLSPADIVSVNKFISIIDKINNRYPFLYLPYFLKDFIDGEYSSQLIQKFNLWSYLGLNYLIENILKFKGKREKKDVENTSFKNFEKEGWRKNYEFFINYCEMFKDELSELLNHNILNALILCQLFKAPLTKTHLLQNIENLLQTYGHKVELIHEQEIKKNFENYLKTALEMKIDKILQNLYTRKYARFESDAFILYPKYAEISKAIMNILSTYFDGIPYDNFRRKLLRENDLLRSIPKMDIWESILDRLEKDNEIVRIRAFWRYSPYRDQLFTPDLFKRKHEELRKQLAAAGSTKFFGRRITPEKFMSELEQLDKGNLDDKDDQVTRLAGMVLASSNLPQSPKEDLKIFDFVIDISNHKFTQEQIAVMSKLNFVITGKIIHVKVMLNEKVTDAIIETIREKLPSGHQAAILTFQKISNKIQENLPQDKSIQVLGREAILAWSKITPVIPCRVNSLAKVTYGQLRGKVVKVNAIDYESGLASILVISTREESTTPVGSLEEIWISNCNVREYDDFAKNYEEFLQIINHYSEPRIIDKAFFETPIRKVGYSKEYLDTKQKEEYVELDPSEKISIFVPKTGVIAVGNLTCIEWKFQFDDAKTSILYNLGMFDNTAYEANQVNYLIRKHFKCSCYYWEGVTHSFKFCNHMIAVLDFMARRMDCLNNTWMNEYVNVISRLLKKFFTLNNLSTIDFLAFSFSNSEIEDFLLYLKNLPCVNCEGGLQISELINLKTRMLRAFNHEPAYVDLFQKVDETIKHMKKNTLRNIVNDINNEFNRQNRRAKSVNRSDSNLAGKF